MTEKKDITGGSRRNFRLGNFIRIRMLAGTSLFQRTNTL